MTFAQKILFCLLFLSSTLLVNSANAQSKNYNKGFKLGLGLDLGYSSNNPYKMALGFDGRLQYDFSKRYSITLTSGFTNIFVDGDNNDLGIIPIKFGFKAFIWNDEFYVMGEGGAAFAVTNNYNKNSIIIAPSIGYATKYIDFSLRYEIYTDFPYQTIDNTTKTGFGQLALRLAYGFKL